MDALQAYICAVQLDKSHTAAWTNLGKSGAAEFSALGYHSVYVLKQNSRSSLILTQCCAVVVSTSASRWTVSPETGAS